MDQSEEELEEVNPVLSPVRHEHVQCQEDVARHELGVQKVEDVHDSHRAPPQSGVPTPGTLSIGRPRVLPVTLCEWLSDSGLLFRGGRVTSPDSVTEMECPGVDGLDILLFLLVVKWVGRWEPEG